MVLLLVKLRKKDREGSGLSGIQSAKVIGLIKKLLLKDAGSRWVVEVLLKSEYYLLKNA